MSVTEFGPESGYCQRWHRGFHSWRHTSEGGFDAAEFIVEPIDEPTAKEYVVSHHYSRSYPAALKRFGLFDRRWSLVGVAVIGAPVSTKALTNVFPQLEPFKETGELSRLVLNDEVPANAESWFLARVFSEAAYEGMRGIVSFSDPVPRHRIDGSVVMPGHVGIIYQALNGVYCGRGTARTITLLPDGTVLNDRSMQKVRGQERGHEHVERKLIELGARVPRAGEATRDWLLDALTGIGARRVRHPGNHRYAWRIGPKTAKRSVRIVGASSEPYPKRVFSLA